MLFPVSRALRERRRREEILNKIEDAKPLKDILEDLLKKSPGLSSLLISGYKLRTPFNLQGALYQEEYEGKEFPTYFKLNLDKTKQCPINRKFRVQYETDATNDYFERDRLPGTFELHIGAQLTTNYSLNLWNGLATLTAALPEKIEVSALIDYKSIATDQTQLKPFEDSFAIQVLKKVEKKGGSQGKRKKPPSDTKDDNRLSSSMLSLPQVVEIRKDEWEKHNFDEFSALEVKHAGEKGYDFYVNMDNIYLLSEIKAKSNLDAKLLQGQYKYALVLVGLSLLNEGEMEDQDSNQEKDVCKEVFEVSKKLSPILLPMIDGLGEMQVVD